MIESMRTRVLAIPGTDKISFYVWLADLPTSKPIQVKVRGDEIDELRQAVAGVEIHSRTKSRPSAISVMTTAEADGAAG